ncbi:peptidase inhibitor family I36 [Micromonospora pisi]|uniref:Peptidase inhibitor family I36 n=1 Tax=Micromonospora pisi TaxID=589240 RepID=A0A495JRF1_9ACTN|nr:peptidase inhibitor family I36 protein [Micromonospora pisi]RKR91215.1 peptidase inhibitor family I36 [Micromonospora pisi]
MMRTRMIAMVGALAGSIGLLGLTGAPALATGSARDCVVDLDHATMTCAATEAQARHQGGVTPAALTIARVYDGTNYSGASLAFVQSRACTPAYDSEWQWDNLGVTSGGNWSNRISSVRTYNKCDVRFFDGVNFGGASSTWIDASANLGAVGSGWSNRASSVKFS